MGASIASEHCSWRAWLTQCKVVPRSVCVVRAAAIVAEYPREIFFFIQTFDIRLFMQFRYQAQFAWYTSLITSKNREFPVSVSYFYLSKRKCKTWETNLQIIKYSTFLVYASTKLMAGQEAQCCSYTRNILEISVQVWVVLLWLIRLCSCCCFCFASAVTSLKVQIIQSDFILRMNCNSVVAGLRPPLWEES